MDDSFLQYAAISQPDTANRVPLASLNQIQGRLLMGWTPIISFVMAGLRPGHPRLSLFNLHLKIWMPGTGPGMTVNDLRDAIRNHVG